MPCIKAPKLESQDVPVQRLDPFFTRLSGSVPFADPDKQRLTVGFDLGWQHPGAGG